MTDSLLYPRLLYLELLENCAPSQSGRLQYYKKERKIDQDTLQGYQI